MFVTGCCLRPVSSVDRALGSQEEKWKPNFCRKKPKRDPNFLSHFPYFYAQGDQLKKEIFVCIFYNKLSIYIREIFKKKLSLEIAGNEIKNSKAKQVGNCQTGNPVITKLIIVKPSMCESSQVF